MRNPQICYPNPKEYRRSTIKHNNSNNISGTPISNPTAIKHATAIITTKNKEQSLRYPKSLRNIIEC
jgi:hypothetical protein